MVTSKLPFGDPTGEKTGKTAREYLSNLLYYILPNPSTVSSSGFFQINSITDITASSLTTGGDA